MNKCYLLVQKAQKFVVSVYLNEHTAIQSMMRLNEEFGSKLYTIIEKKLFTY